MNYNSNTHKSGISIQISFYWLHSVPVFSRWSRKKCVGADKKYEACSSRQCYNVPRTTVLEHAKQICNRAKAFDNSISDDAIQEVSSNPEDSCKMYCNSTTGKPVTKSWIFPDGTTCRNVDSDLDDNYYCVNGRCEVVHFISVLILKTVVNSVFLFTHSEIFV